MAIVSKQMLDTLTYRELCVLCTIMDRAGKINKVREDYKDILIGQSFALVFSALKEKKFITHINNNYVSYKQVSLVNALFKTNSEIIIKKELTWKARFILAGIYESFLDDDGTFVLTKELLDKFGSSHSYNFRTNIKKYVSEDSLFLREDGTVIHNRWELTRYRFYKETKTSTQKINTKMIEKKYVEEVIKEMIKNNDIVLKEVIKEAIKEIVMEENNIEKINSKSKKKKDSTPKTDSILFRIQKIFSKS